MAREYISLVERTSDEATIEVEIRPKIDNALGDEVVAARKTVHELDERQREVAALPRAPAKDRAESGLSVTSPGLMGGGEQDAALTNTDANLPATPAVGQGPRNTWEQSIDLPSRTQPTPISVNDGSSRFDRWPGECIHASITAAGVAAALLRFSAAVVPDAQSAMTPPSGACVSSAFPIKADARCRAAACAHVEPPSVGRPLARRTSLVPWMLFGDGRDQQVGQTHTPVPRESRQGSLDVHGPLPVLVQDGQVLVCRPPVRPDLLVVLCASRAEQGLEVKGSAGSDQAGRDQRGQPFGDTLVMYASRCAGVDQIAGNYRHTRALSSLSAKSLIAPPTRRSTSRRLPIQQ